MTRIKLSTHDLMGALPGTTRQIVYRTGASATTIRRLLRALIDQGVVDRRTRWLGSLAHTNVYRRSARR